MAVIPPPSPDIAERAMYPMISAATRSGAMTAARRPPIHQSSPDIRDAPSRARRPPTGIPNAATAATYWTPTQYETEARMAGTAAPITSACTRASVDATCPGGLIDVDD